MMTLREHSCRILPVIFLGVLLAASPVLRGQEETRRVSIQVLSMDSAGIEDLFIRSGDTWTSLHAPATYVPDPVTYEGTSPVVIYLRQESDEPDSFEYVPVASQAIPEGLDDVLLLLRQRSENKQLTVFPVRLQQDRFPPGSFLFFNQTAKPVGIVIEDERITIEARATRQFTPSTREAKTLQVNMLYLGDEELDSLVANTWFYRPSLRQLAFIVPDENPERFMVRVINLHGVDP